jgi:hypothetical protein
MRRPSGGFFHQTVIDGKVIYTGETHPNVQRRFVIDRWLTASRVLNVAAKLTANQVASVSTNKTLVVIFTVESIIVHLRSPLLDL